jgi:replicative DNA helicase
MIPTGMPTLNAVIGGGLAPGLHVIAGRVMTGKSLLVQAIGLNALQAGNCVCIASVEHPSESFVHRMVSRISRVPVNRLGEYGTEEERSRALAATRQLANEHHRGFPIPFKGGHFTCDHIRQQLELEAERRCPPQLLLVDTIRGVGPEIGDDREGYEFAEYVADELQKMASDFQMPVVVTAHLNRALESKPPVMADLVKATCLGLARKALTVLLVHRPDVYDHSYSSGEIDVIVAKTPTLTTGTLTLGWVGHIGTARDMDLPFKGAPKESEDQAMSIGEIVAGITRDLKGNRS